MPVIEAPLFDYLSAELSVGDRVYPLRGPEGVTLPYVTWQRISAVRENDHDPFGVMRAWVRARTQFNCWSTSPLEAISIGEELVEVLNGLSGDMEGVAVGSVDVVSELDDYQSDTKLFRRIVDAVFSYQEGGAGS